jgi:hypothetical protein
MTQFTVLVTDDDQDIRDDIYRVIVRLFALFHHLFLSNEAN